MDTDRLAGIVAMAIKAALAPYQERIAALESTLSRVATIDQALMDLRDRVTISETKAAAVVIPDVPVVDLTPVYDRLATVEARSERVAEFGTSLLDLRDRVLVSETKAATIPVTLPAVDVPVVDLTPVHDRLTALEQKATTLGERVAAVEVKPLIPGPQGQAGKDGKDGKDGLDGVGFDELTGEYDERGHLNLKFSRGANVKTFRVPGHVSQGTWNRGEHYLKGETVAWADSTWVAITDVCGAEPGRPEKESRAWKLSARGGNRANSNRSTNTTTDSEPLPVVKVVHAG